MSEAIYLALLAVPTTAVGALWAYFKKDIAECKRDRRLLWLAVNQMLGGYHAFKNCPIKDCVMRDTAVELLEGIEEDLDPKKAKDHVLKETGLAAHLSRAGVPTHSLEPQ